MRHTGGVPQPSPHLKTLVLPFSILNGEKHHRKTDETPASTCPDKSAEGRSEEENEGRAPQTTAE